MEPRHSPAFGHVGITVPSVDRAASWYRDVLGLELMAGPTDVHAHDGHAGRMASNVFGPSFRAMRQAHLIAGNGVAVELFEFVVPATRPAERFAYWQTGPFHVCLVERDIAALAERIRAAGGAQWTDVLCIRPGEPYRMCYCEDPFGTVLELYSHNHDETYGRPADVEAADRSA